MKKNNFKKFLIIPIISLFMIAGCSNNMDPKEIENAPLSEGNLEVISSKDFNNFIEKDLIESVYIGLSNVSKTVAVFDKPNGVSIGRIDPGVYKVLSIEKRFAEIIIPIEENSKFGIGWVSLNDDTKIIFKKNEEAQSK